MNKRKYIMIILIVVLAFTIAGCKRESEGPPAEEIPIEDHSEETADESESEAEGSEVDTETEESIPEEEEDLMGIHQGNVLPQFTLENEEGSLVDVSSYRGKPLMFTFWVSWSEESKEQLEILSNVELLLGDDVAFVAIHGTGFDTVSLQEAIDIMGEFNDALDTLYDIEGVVQQKLYVGKFPTTFFVDSDGKVYKTYTAIVEEDKILEDYEEILGEVLP
ncbi:TlpA family protein disulfide reductase [Alkaliphilus serpentinus]|uniref:TlpA family protein disulfide reductase n=1 Tax=Alkaliphilus serpentinus TaxID=1482731 RepID=A0A833HQH3_9FIRM|nr:TlpA disulfide reductase family protein [Alkaliphilus serpentinus]KAB3531812.1 TlpA family protein disulfide reductase [Alkaliphilus serpentinus]